MPRFTGQVVIVTGASQGIGAATAIAFAGEGAHVVINYNASEAGAHDTLAAIEAGGAGAGTLVQANIGLPADCERLVAAAEAIGPVTVLVNNAAGFNRAPFLEVDLTELDRVWAINGRGLFYLSQLAARRMAGRRRGSIIHVSSILAQHAVPQRAVYSATKGAVEALTRAMALDLAAHNVRVNAVAPGLIETQAMLAGFPGEELLNIVRTHIPAKRFGAPEELAQAILFLASDAASYINGIVLPVDGALGAREAGPVRD
ncbi:MAG: Gluconate 5-dehydrogenase [Anaerolineae bacterium]|nr:Gluconate 5-dehydrogenase [Anaerolineae bacterium]